MARTEGDTVSGRVRARPPNYPVCFERRTALRDGREVWIRPITPADAPELAAAIDDADPDTLYRRFLGAPPHVTDELMTYLTTLDYRDRFALVAGDPTTDSGVGIARYELLSEGVAEVAVVVRPAWRRVGLATALIEMLAEAAVTRGVHTFSASYLAENRPVSALVAHAGGTNKELIKEGITEIAVALREGGARRPGDVAPPAS